MRFSAHFLVSVSLNSLLRRKIPDKTFREIVKRRIGGRKENQVTVPFQAGPRISPICWFDYFKYMLKMA